jgi:Rieske Fe-S protein
MEKRLPISGEIAAPGAALASDPVELGCAGCSRRDLVTGLGLAAAAALLGACTDGDGGDEPGPDAGDPTGGVTMCGAALCVAISAPENAPLQSVGGSRVITTATEKLLVVRTSATELAVLTAICTHAGCTVGYSGDRISCPCHGSQFSLSGAVTRGPAARSLARYSSTFDAATQVLTIQLV